MEKEIKPMEKAETKVLPSGLEVAVIRKPGYVRKYAVLATRFGSEVTDFRFGADREEYELPPGTAHFLEHKLFEQEKGNMEEKFSELGASSNAFTSSDITGYLYCTNENFYECLGLLFELVYKPVFSDLGVESEKDIIRQEIMMTRDDPDWMGYRTLLALMYKDHPVAIDPAGTSESIAEITPEVLYAAHDAFYSSDNMTLLVVGDVNPEDVFNVAAILESKVGGKPGQKVEVKLKPEQRQVAMAEGRLDMDVARPIMWFGFKDDPAAFGKDASSRRMAASVLAETLFGPSSALNDSLYTSGIIDDNLSYDEHYSQEYGYVNLVAATNRPDELMQKVMAAVAEAAAGRIDEEAFELSRRRLIGSQLKSFDSEEFIAYEFLVDRFRGFDLMERPSLLDRAGLEHVKEVALSIFAEGHSSVLSVMPTKADAGE